MDASSIAFRGDEFFVGILNCYGPAPKVIKGHSETLADVFGGAHRFFGVIADFLQKPEHGVGGAGG
jgi:hypothetical protein